MKKFKLLSCVAGISTLCFTLPSITACSSNKYTVELVSKLAERKFNDRTSGCTFRFKVANEQVAKITNADMVNFEVDGVSTKVVDGLFKYSYDNNGYLKIVVSTKVILQNWPDASKFTFDLVFTNKETKETVKYGTYVLNYDDSVRVQEVETCDWSILKERTDAYYGGRMTLEMFCSLFSKDGEELKSLNDFIGLEKEATINGVTHTLKITDTQHDTIAKGEEHAGQKALFTFDLANLVSDSTGSLLKSAWKGPNNDNTNYLNSTLKANLTGTATWTDGSGTVMPNALTMLTNGSPELQDCIKTVTKEYHYRESNQWKLGTYNDKLFAPTYYEIVGGTCSTSLQEGTQYEYWKTHNTQADRQKRDANGNRFNYWTISICTGGTTHAWDVWDGQEDLQGSTASTEFGVSFAFCI